MHASNKALGGIVIERIVFLPMPPLLFSAVAGNAASELDELRAVINSALTEAVAETASIAVLGTDEGQEIAEYLLSQVPGGPTGSPTDLADEPADSTVLLVMGDGTAKRTEKAPGYIDDRAAGFDDQIREIFESGELAKLADLDEELGHNLWVAGIEPWRLVGSWITESETSWQLKQFHFEDPYGVAYFVASFARRAD